MPNLFVSEDYWLVVITIVKEAFGLHLMASLNTLYSLLRCIFMVLVYPAILIVLFVTRRAQLEMFTVSASSFKAHLVSGEKSVFTVTCIWKCSVLCECGF